LQSAIKPIRADLGDNDLAGFSGCCDGIYRVLKRCGNVIAGIDAVFCI
jgi:hypothetical protein